MRKIWLAEFCAGADLTEYLNKLEGENWHIFAVNRVSVGSDMVIAWKYA
jgi:hypothetical protein